MSEDANRDASTADSSDEDSSCPGRNTKRDASAGDSSDESPPPSHPIPSKKRRRASDGDDRSAAGSDSPTLNHTPPPRSYTMALRGIFDTEDTMENNANDADVSGNDDDAADDGGDDDNDDDKGNDAGADSSFNALNKLTPKASQPPQPLSNQRSLACTFAKRKPDQDKGNDAGVDSSFNSTKKLTLNHRANSSH
ncbi:hypothetical protein V8C35DRAFT_284162 [Trichoderma chlorosporum]